MMGVVTLNHAWLDTNPRSPKNASVLYVRIALYSYLHSYLRCYAFYVSSYTCYIMIHY